MEQRDYILREIEKIGLLLRAIRQKLFGGGQKPAIPAEKQAQYLQGQLLNETAFDLDLFLALGMDKSIEYIGTFKGFNADNLALLAECIAQIGLNHTTDHSEKYLEKALQLYECCKLKDRIYSFERELKIAAIKKVLQQEE